MDDLPQFCRSALTAGFDQLVSHGLAGWGEADVSGAPLLPQAIAGLGAVGDRAPRSRLAPWKLP
jgi:hypothetical protein